MSEFSQNQNNPTGIWQSMWCDLFKQFFDQYTTKNYLGAFETLKILKKSIPPECEKDVTLDFEKVSSVFNKTGKPTYGYWAYEEAQFNKMHRIITETPMLLLELLGSIRNSLYEKGWINKNFGAKPRFEKKGHLSIPGA